MRLTTAVRILVIAAALMMTRSVRAEQYDVFIDIETEEDLYELFTSGQIDETTFNLLVSLYQRGVDLNEATREELYALPNLNLGEVDQIIAYRDEAGWIADPANLAINGIISEQQLLAIAPFLRLRDRNLPAYAVDGLVRAQTRWSTEDDRIPPMALLARVATYKHLRVGVAATLTRNRLGEVVYDPNRDALSAAPHSSQVHLPKAYAFWSTDDWDAIAGTYRIGFGQRLTFDNTDQSLPNGIYPDDELRRSTDLTRECKESRGELQITPCDTNVYVTPDFAWTDRLLGVAVGLKRIPAGPGILQTYGFFSMQPKGIYQYELYDPDQCADPRDDSDPACSAPTVYRRQDDPLAPTSRYSFSTLPDMYREMVAGGNVTFHASPRVRFGMTGYGANVTWLTEGLDLGFQEWSRTPYGGRFGAVGFDLAWGGPAWLDLFAEVARSFDSMGEERGVGLGAITRAVITWDRNEIEASLRYYDQGFANPYARPISAADELDGLRARDEAGGRVRYTARPNRRTNLRANLDLWHSPSQDQLAMLAYLRGDIDLDRRTRVGAWTQYQDKGLNKDVANECFEVSIEEDERGEPIRCSGQKWQWAAQARVEPSRLWFASGQLRLSALDDGRYTDKQRYDASALGSVTVKPAPALRIHGRVRYLFEDVSDNNVLEQSVWAYLDLTYKLPSKYKVRVRYDYLQRLDDRASTLDRRPNPESWLWLEVESRF
ncbi:MAG TPA: helix-hairpin-helix domain-containing protein [Kofleriaceae bacterium]|nr:helix-hairpin-helix domain-containing protein [Kofleriaceae bacterium]